MEYKNNKDYQVVEATIATLEGKLEYLQKIQFQDINLLKKEVTEHFQQCISILNDRMNSLINQLTDMSQQQGTIKTELERIKENLCGCIQQGKDLLDSGVNMHKNNPTIATHIWRGTQLIEVPRYSEEQFTLKVEINLNSSILDTLHSHGTVICQYQTVLNKSVSSDNCIQNIETDLKRLNTFDLTANYELTNQLSPSTTVASTSSSIHSSLSSPPLPSSSESTPHLAKVQKPTSSWFQEKWNKEKAAAMKKAYFDKVETIEISKMEMEKMLNLLDHLEFASIQTIIVCMCTTD